MDCVSLWCFFTSERAQKTTRHFMKNKHSFYRKQHVVLMKTSRRFMKTSHRFIQKSPLMETKKKSSRHNLHKYKYKEDY